MSETAFRRMTPGIFSTASVVYFNHIAYLGKVIFNLSPNPLLSIYFVSRINHYVEKTREIPELEHPLLRACDFSEEFPHRTDEQIAQPLAGLLCLPPQNGVKNKCGAISSHD